MSDEPRRESLVDADPGDGRNESLNERLDRNWTEILQELRVTQTGTQILTGFLLAIAFQNRFAELNQFQHYTYLVVVSLAVLTTAIGLAPVQLHRGLFRRHRKLELVRVGNVLLQLVLVGVALVLTGTMLLVFDVVMNRAAAVVAAVTTLVVTVVIFALPRVLRRLPETGPAQHAGEGPG